MKKICQYCQLEFETSHPEKNHCALTSCKEKYHKEKSYASAICPTCQSDFQFRKSKPKTYCSKKCAQANPIVIEKMIQSQNKTYERKYGCHPMQTDQVKANFRKAMRDTYGEESPFFVPEFKKKAIDSIKRKYGVECVFQNEGIKVKSKETKERLYGNKNFNNANTAKKTKLQKHGSYLTIMEKAKNTSIEKYGEPHYTNRIKAKKTMREKYGVEYPLQIDGYKKSVYFKSFASLTSDEKFQSIKPAFSENDFHGMAKDYIYDFVCLKCHGEFRSNLWKSKIPKCPKCHTIATQKTQLEIYDFIKSVTTHEIILNDRKILKGLELDIYIPKLKMAIEYDGLYWHSELNGKDKKYHLNKTDACKKLGIQLIHIFENEWIHKKPIVKSIIKSKLCSTKKIYARNCDVSEVSSKIANTFLQENHLQGSDSSKIRIALFDCNTLVCLMTFSKPRFNKSYEWELSRFSTQLDHSVIGGASKILLYFISKYDPKSIITYSDLRYFSGEVYKKLTFIREKDTSPNYFYIQKDHRLANRLRFQKHKLKSILQSYDASLTEWENMKNNGYNRIWDCGNAKYTWKK